MVGGTPTETNGTRTSGAPIFFFRGGSSLKSPTKQRMVNDSLIFEMEKELKGLTKFCASKKNMFLEVKDSASRLSLLVRQMRSVPLHGKRTACLASVATQTASGKGPKETMVLGTYADAVQPVTPDSGPGQKRPLPSPEEAQKDKEAKRKKEEEVPFILVAKKKKKKKKNSHVTVIEADAEGPSAGPGPGTQRTTAAKDTKPKRRQRPEAVLITPDESRSSGEVLRALRSKLSLEDLTIGVRSVRTARKGGLLIEFNGTVKDRSGLERKITEAAGGEVAVRCLVPTTTLVVDGMDAATTVEEVMGSLVQSLGEGASRVKINITKPNKWGSVRAFVEVGLSDAATLETLGKVKVGWLVCRIRRWERLDRCFRCHGLGHSAGSCKSEVDRSGLCWRCGQADHQAKACPNPPSCHLCAAVKDGRTSDHVAGAGQCAVYRDMLRKKMAKVLQANLQRCKLAFDLLLARNRDCHVDIALVSEQYHAASGPDWLCDPSGTAAIWIPDRGCVFVMDSGSEDGIVWVKTPAVTYVSCYFTPNEPVAVFRKRVDKLERVVRSFEGEIVIGGDFNAKSIEWGMAYSDTRGDELLDMMASLELVILNRGNTATFRRAGARQSILDLTFATQRIAGVIADWSVSEEYTASDHQYVSYTVHSLDVKIPTIPQRQMKRTGWRTSTLDERIFQREISNKIGALLDQTVESRDDVEALVGQTMGVIVAGCNAAMSSHSAGSRRKPVYWWTTEIALLRAQCLRLRRQALRSRKRDSWQQKNDEYKAVKKQLVTAIRESKGRCWRAICKEVDDDLWGKGYQIVMRKFVGRNPVAPMDPDAMAEIVHFLFPEREEREHFRSALSDDECPLFSAVELREVVKSLKVGKAPGPDGIPVEAYKVLIKQHEHLLLRTFNACIKAGVFPRRWKLQRLVLLDKGKGPPYTPSSYRPLCMLDVAGKIFEALIRNRLREAVADAGGLAENQHGFRPGRSTIGAISEALSFARTAWKGNHRSRPVCIMMTFDVKNAFNSARWSDIMEALEKLGLPEYLIRIIDDYLRDRFLIYETTMGETMKKLSGGAAQGSVLGPELWIILYDALLRLDLPSEVILEGFADDVAALILARSYESAQRLASHVAFLINAWLTDHGMGLAKAKTEIVVLTAQRWFPRPFSAFVVDQHIESREALKYLGVTIDTKLTFQDQIVSVATKAAKTVANLSRLMPNIGGPRSSRRRALMSVSNSIMLYGVEVWGEALRVERYRKRLASVQRRGALRISCAYRTVSEDAALVIAGAIPIDLLGFERGRVWDARRRGEGPLMDVKNKEREVTLALWQERWNASEKGRWTHRLIKRARDWISRERGEVDYYLTQFLSGHGQFNEYLCRMGIRNDPHCQYCPGVVDSAEHTFFFCERWSEIRLRFQREKELPNMAELVIPWMLATTDGWTTMTEYVREVLLVKKKEEE